MWALVRYKDTTTEEVPIEKIAEEYINSRGKTKTRPFEPNSFTDFKCGQWYRVSTTKDLPDGFGESSYYALIGRLAESQEELVNANCPRVRWPNVQHHMDTNEPNSALDDSEAGNSSTVVGLEREKKKNKKEKKRKGESAEFNAFMKCYQINDSMSEAVADETTGSSDDLLAKIRKLEKALRESNKEKEELRQKNESFQKIAESLGQKVDALHTTVETKFEANDKNITELKNHISSVETLLSKSAADASNHLQHVQNWINTIPVENSSHL